MSVFSREEIATLIPLYHAYAEGKTIQIRSGDNWIDCMRPAFDSGVSFYRIKPEADVIVADAYCKDGEEAVVLGDRVLPCHLAVPGSKRYFVQATIRPGDRVRIVPREDDEILDKLVPDRTTSTPFKHYEPRLDGELSWALMREKGQEFADNEQLVPMVRDLGHWLVLAIDELKTWRAKKDEPAESVCDRNWESDGTIIASEDIPALWAEIRYGVAIKHTIDEEWDASWLYVPSPIAKSERVQVIKSNNRDFRDKLVRVEGAVCKPVCDANQDGYDPVNRPKHYVSDPSGYECIQFAEHMSMSLGNATKYLWRMGLKDDAIEQLQKSVWYLKNHLKIDPSSAAALNIYKVIHGKQWPIAEAMRLIWRVSQRLSVNHRGDIQDAIEILEAEIDRRKENTK